MSGRSLDSNALYFGAALDPAHVAGHDRAETDVHAVLATLTRELTEVWGCEPRSAILTAQRAHFATEAG